MLTQAEYHTNMTAFFLVAEPSLVAVNMPLLKQVICPDNKMTACTE